MTFTRWSARFALAALVLSAAPALTLAPAGAAPGVVAAAAPKPWVSVKGPDVFSPNGDGRHDTARFKVKVKKRANVTLKVVRAGKVVRGPIKLGKRKAGSTIAWTWNGKNRKGKRVADAGSDGRKPYQIKVAARSLKTGKKVVVRRDVAVDTKADLPSAARLIADSNTVYPNTTVVHDRIMFRVDGVDLDSAENTNTGALVIRTLGGTKLREIQSDRWNTASYWGSTIAWDGKREDGGSLNLGGDLEGKDVTARLRVEDSVGNVAQTPPITIRVSGRELLLKKAETTVAAQRTEFAPTPHDCGPGTGNGCGENFPCGTVVPSTRADMPLGLSYTAKVCSDPAFPGLQPRAVARHSLDLPDDAVRGGAALSVTMRGRATVDGETDTAALTVHRTSVVSDAVTGETTTTASRGGYDIAQGELYSSTGGFERPHWVVETFDDDSYDVSEFDVTYAYLVPSSS